VTDFNLPELGENVTAGDVLRVLVKPGDTLAKDQPVLELETDKATIEVPSSVAGQVKDVKVKAGDKVKVGQAILSVDDGGASASAAPKAEAPKTEPPKTEPRPAPPEATAPSPTSAAAGANTAAKVPADNAGLEQHVEGTRRDTAADKPGVARAASQDNKVVDINRAPRADQQRAEPAPQGRETPPAPAAPSVRRMARELGVDIDQVAGSGDGGRISIDDVKAHAKRLVTGAARGSAAPQ
jgi:pyruvate dehydrogenase E2 component (dihydrolipoamide acetyltransferase)